MKLVFCLFCLLLIVLLIKYNEHFNNPKHKHTKPRVVVCLFGVIPRSIKYTWESININIIQKLKEKYSVDIYIFNLDVEDTKVDGVKLNKNDINIIPYNIKEEYKQHELDKTIDKFCSKIQCKIHKYSKNTNYNSIRQMYSEYRVGKFLEKNKSKYIGAVVVGPDYYILNPIKEKDFSDSIHTNKSLIYLTQIGNGSNGGYTNGLYFGKIDNLNKILFRYLLLHKYLPTKKDYEYILKKACVDSNINIRISDIIFFKIRANKKAILQTRPQHSHLIKDYNKVKYKLNKLNNKLNS